MAKFGSKTGKQGNQPDMFHGDGNSTVSLPKNVNSGKRKFVDPHTNAGALTPTRKVTHKGWNK